MNLFIDTHAHLNDPAFDADRAAVLSAVFAAGVIHCTEIGCQEPEWEPALALASQYPGKISAVLGIHPEEARTLTPQNLARLASLLPDERVRALGEIGLDYSYLHTSNKETQINAFVQLLGLTKTVQKPVVLHVRRQDEDYAVYDDVFAHLKTDWTPAANAKHAGVLHCFCARYEEAKKALDMGLLLGINGCFTYKKNEYIREAVKKAGADKIIFETDCPYLAPQGKRGTRNDPANIPLIAAYTADYLAVPLPELAVKTTQTAKELYALD